MLVCRSPAMSGSRPAIMKLSVPTANVPSASQYSGARDVGVLEESIIVTNLRCQRVLGIERIVGVADFGAAKEGGAVIRIQRQLPAQAFGQIGICDEVAAQCDQ